MSKFFLILSAFALIVSVTVCASHAAHASDGRTSSEISISVDADAPDDNTSLGSNGCDMSCGGCCVHHVIHSSHGASNAVTGKDQLFMPDTTLFVSDFIYGLKRPPKS